MSDVSLVEFPGPNTRCASSLLLPEEGGGSHVASCALNHGLDPLRTEADIDKALHIATTSVRRSSWALHQHMPDLLLRHLEFSESPSGSSEDLPGQPNAPRNIQTRRSQAYAPPPQRRTFSVWWGLVCMFVRLPMCCSFPRPPLLRLLLFTFIAHPEPYLWTCQSACLFSVS